MAASTTATAERRAIVDRARQSWIERLIDLSRRNNLLFFRHLKRGTLDLTGADRDALDGLFGDTAVGLEKLLPDADGDRLAAQVVDISRRAQANRDERNLETLYVAYGLATWKSEDGGRPAEAPIVLLPVAVEKRHQGTRVSLRRTGAAKINPVLLHVLNVAHRCGVDEEALLSAAEREDEESRLDFNGVFGHLVQAAAAVPLAPDPLIPGNWRRLAGERCGRCQKLTTSRMRWGSAQRRPEGGRRERRARGRYAGGTAPPTSSTSVLVGSSGR